jgi:hypothetical protein
MVMLLARSRAVSRRLLARARKMPTMRNDRQIMVTEKTFRARNCQRLFPVVRR